MRSLFRSAACAALAIVAASCADTLPTAPAPATLTPGGQPSLFVAPAATVRITEIRYDVVGTDVGEAVEIAGPAGMSLDGWALVRYNGASTSRAPYGTTSLGALNAACGSRGVLVVTFPTDGLQNGAPDGLALVDPAGAVVEFLSYEGTFVAASGPAAGMTSTDIGVAQSNETPLDESLQRADATTWRASAPNTFGACNDSEGGETAPVASIVIDPASATIVRGAVQALSATARDAAGNVVAATITWSSSDETIAAVNGSGTVTGVAAGTATITATSGAASATAAITVEESTTPPATSVWISEIHYDNASTDVNEGIEVEAPAGVSLAGWRVYLYNGGTTPLAAPVYTPTPTLTGTIPAQCDGRGTLFFPIPGIQNGHPDAIALVDASGAVVDFIAYGGAMTGGAGPATGMAATVIGVVENSSSPATHSLQRKGGTWVGPLPQTFGACNGDAPPPPPTKSIRFAGWGPSGFLLPLGYEDQLFATLVVDGTNTSSTIAWRSLDEGIATVDQDGVVHAVASGEVGIEAKAADGTTGIWTVRTGVAARGTATYLPSTEFGTPADADASDDHLIVREQYTSSYSRIRNTANWVAWASTAENFVTGAQRCDCFTMDPELPASFPRYTTNAYTNSAEIAGFSIDRGHLTPSFDRTNGAMDNATTFLFSNVIPQASGNNQGPWEALESALADSARTAGRVIYNVAGVAGSLGTLKNEGIVTIPAYVWKVAVILPAGRRLADIDSHDDLEVIAVVMPNVNEIRNTPWGEFAVTVDSVEALSGYDVLSLLRDDVERAVESNTVPPVAVAGGPYSAMQGEAFTVSGAMSSDGDGQTLTYAWTFGTSATATGMTASHTFATPGTYAVRLIVTDALGLADTATTTVTVSSHADNVTRAIGMIDALDLGGRGRAIIVKLESTLRALGAERETAMVHLRQAKQQLDGFVEGGHVAAPAAQPVQALLARIIAAME